MRNMGQISHKPPNGFVRNPGMQLFVILLQHGSK